jgi:4-amino-4-deoxy-L-arabinose transferase-like glycosyltransferase
MSFAPQTSRPWTPVLAVIAIALATSLWLAGAYPLIDPDEGRNAEVAREMMERGDAIIPRLAGMPYLDKPPALFWAAGAAIGALGPTPFAARLPAVLAAALTLLVLARLALREADPAFAWRALALTAAAPLFAVISAYVIFDMPLTLCVTVVWTGLARELACGAEPRRRTAMFLALALGVLIKGPVMLAWALGGSLAAALLLRRADALRWLGWWPGWFAFLALAGGWFALATARHPEYPRYAFLEESFERLTSGTFKREQPWWFVPAVLAGGALPWSLATPWLALRHRAGGVGRAPVPGGRIAARVALGFVLFAAVFFTLSRSKLVTYLLPALPPLAWLAAAAWIRHAGPARRWGFVAVLLFTPLLLILGYPALLDYARSQSGAGLAQAVTAAGGGPVRFEGCYSPGTDYLLDRRGLLLDVSGAETTSNYQLRYRDSLIARGLWTPVAGNEDRTTSDLTTSVLVRSAKRDDPAPAGWREFHRDIRFVAFRREPLR